MSETLVSVLALSDRPMDHDGGWFLRDESNSDTDPETLEPPAESKRQGQAKRQRDDVVCNQVRWSADGLLSYAAEDTVGAGAKPVEYLHDGHQR